MYLLDYVDFFQHVSLVSRCCSSLVSRLLVSASQDGKLIIWDSYTTNKVRLFIIDDRILMQLFLYILLYILS